MTDGDEPGILELLAKVTSFDVGAFQLQFDIEAWDAVSGSDSPGEAAFRVSVEADTGDGMVKIADFGTVGTGPTLVPSVGGNELDGNADANRVSFDSGRQLAVIPEGSTLRVRWEVDRSAQSQGWVYGLDNVVLRVFPGLPNKFRVDQRGSDLVFTWDSQAGKLYNLRSETAPSTDPATWPIFDGHRDLAATPPENTLTIPRPAESERFFVIEEFPAPPAVVFSDDFENGSGAWTTGSDGAAGTAWQLGTPSNVGPPGANSPANCFGTNISSEYTEEANVWLRSPPIDLSTAAEATVKYAHYWDIEREFDFGSVRVLDASDDAELAVLENLVDGASVGWEEVSKTLPAAALGKTIKLEFRLQSDDFRNLAGWYLDDVEVTVP